MAHTITLHLLDAPGRLSRFQRKHPELAGRIPKKELAAYLNLTPETLSRLKHHAQQSPPWPMSNLYAPPKAVLVTRPKRHSCRGTRTASTPLTLFSRHCRCDCGN